MSRRIAFFRVQWHVPAVVTFVLIFFGGIVLADAPAEKAVDTTTAKRLVSEAQTADVAGDTDKCYRLLREAVRVAPDFPLARWQLRQMQVNGKWVSVEEAQRRAAADPKQIQYRELRNQLGETPPSQLELARWCRRNKLDDEARFHWASVLSVDPRNDEALAATGMQWADGRLLSKGDIAKLKQEQRKLKEAAKAWKPKVSKWQRALVGKDVASNETALREIRAVAAVDAIPAFEAVTLVVREDNDKTPPGSVEMSLALIEALAAMPAPAATVSLARHSILSPTLEVRTAAIEQLKRRPQHEYVPLLLNALAMPLESSFSVVAGEDGSVHYRHSLYREGQNSDWSSNTRLSAMQNDLGGRVIVYDVASDAELVGPPTSSLPGERIRRANLQANYLGRYSGTAAATEQQVAAANQFTEALNELIMQSLSGATGQKLAAPKAWWDWWRDHNEVYLEEREVQREYYSNTETDYTGYPAYTVQQPAPPSSQAATGMQVQVGAPRFGECFAKGTPVWTKIGQRAIETLEIGDLVLAQNIDTGELAYRPLIARSVRPPSDTVVVKVRGEEIRTTLGHPFWVSGAGWRMAKELKEGLTLHGIANSTQVVSVTPADKLEAYNLVVADFNTYFVGESGVMVHDNTPRTPSRLTVPGVAAK